MQLDLIGAALLGLLVGVGGMLAFRLSEATIRGAPVQESPDADVGAVLGALPSISVLLDAADTVIRASPDAYPFGLVRGEYISAPAVADLVAQVRRDGSAVSTRITWQRTDGAPVIVDAQAAPLSRSRVLVLAQDQTAKLRLDEVRRDFVANVSHELKTPVGAISLLAETVEVAAQDPEAVRRFSAQMAIEASRLSSLVQEIIDLSRLQSPDAEIQVAPVEVARVLTDARDWVELAASRRGVDITVETEPGLRVLGNGELLTTAVRNLIDNAVRYGPDHSRVAVTARKVAEFAEIVVVDQGVGIPASEADRVFERFYRADQARSRATGGTGLGLSIVKHVAANHGGDVTLWSRPGAGATFTLRIPRITSRAESAIPLDPHRGDSHHPKGRPDDPDFDR